MKEREINSYFEGVILNIDIILNNSFYKNKTSLNEVKNKVIKWCDSYKKYKTLKKIHPRELENMDLEITVFFAQYVTIEPLKENYAERLSYNFSELERYWKKEMLEGNLNER